MTKAIYTLISFLAGALPFGWLSCRCEADPLLDENRIFYCDIRALGGGTQVRVLPDETDGAKFYYIPPQPLIATRELKIDGRLETLPVFHIFRYQRKDGSQSKDGAVVQFALTFALPPKALAELRREIRIQTKIPDDSGFALEPVPVRDAHVEFFGPSDSTEAGLRISSARRETLIARRHLGDTASYSLNFARSEAAKFSTLITSSAGLPLVCTFEYDAISPVAGFMVQLDWVKIREFMSSGSEFANPERWGVATWMQNVSNNNHDAQLRALIYAMADAGCLSFAQRSNALDARSVANIQQAAPVLQMIYKEVFGTPISPLSIGTTRSMITSTDEPKRNGVQQPQHLRSQLSRRRAEQLQVEIAAVDLQMPRRVVVSASVQASLSISAHVKNKSQAEALLNGTVDPSSDEVLRRFISYSGSNLWELAYFMLPGIVAEDSLGLNEIEMEVTVTDGIKQMETKTAVWNPSKGGFGEWALDGKPTNYLPFDLLTLPQEFGEFYRQRARFKVRTTFRTKDDQFSDEHDLPMFSGEVPIAFHMNRFHTVTVSGSQLPFDEETDGLLLRNVKLLFKPSDENARVITRTINKATPEGSFLLHAPNNKLSYTVNAEFHYRNRQEESDSYMDWSNNDQKQFTAFVSLYDPRGVKIEAGSAVAIPAGDRRQ